MKRKLLVIFFLFSALGIATVFLLAGPFSKVETKTILINGQPFEVALADNDITRLKGLSGRDPWDPLEPNRGMLFIFRERQRYAFWMNEMKFAIDILWIDGDKIMEITPNIPFPQSNEEELKTYQPQSLVDKVLEIKAGRAAELKIISGDKIIFPQ